MEISLYFVEPESVSFSEETLINAVQSVIGKNVQGRVLGPVAGTVPELASAERLNLPKTWSRFLISKFRRVLKFCAFFSVIPRRLNFIYRRFGTLSLFHLHRQVGMKYSDLPMKMEKADCSETSAYKIQAPGNYPEESILQWSRLTVS